MASNLAEMGKSSESKSLNKSEMKHSTPEIYEITSNQGFSTSQIKRGNSTIEMDNKIWMQN